MYYKKSKNLSVVYVDNTKASSPKIKLRYSEIYAITIYFLMLRFSYMLLRPVSILYSDCFLYRRVGIHPSCQRVS